ncbi:hypothetical protein PM082_018208 [Marasmius tenuissimus]|nr:hypothetical protein PM082_018208 [Marasmius tenuissimus]
MSLIPLIPPLRAQSLPVWTQSPRADMVDSDQLEAERLADPVASASGSPNINNARGGNKERDAQENGTREDLANQLTPKVEKYIKVVKQATHVGAVSSAVIASISASILQTYRSEDDWDKEKFTSVVLVICSFGSITFNINVTVKSLMMICDLSYLTRELTREQELLRRSRSKDSNRSATFLLPGLPGDIRGRVHHLVGHLHGIFT